MTRKILMLTVASFAIASLRAETDAVEKNITKGNAKFLKAYAELGKTHNVSIAQALKDRYVQLAQEQVAKKKAACGKVDLNALVGVDALLTVVAAVNLGYTGWKLYEEYGDNNTKNPFKTHAIFGVAVCAFLKSGLELYKGLKQTDKKKEALTAAEKALGAVQAIPVQAAQAA